MLERFTERARKVMALSNQEARRFNHRYIGTEHILLGLLKEGSGVGPNVLKNLDVDLHKVRMEVERRVKPGPEMVAVGELPQTPLAKNVLEYAVEEARNLNHNYIGTEHLMLGLLREQDGLAARIMMDLALEIDEVRQVVIKLLGAGMDVEVDDIPLASPSDADDKLADELVKYLLDKFTRGDERATALYVARHDGRLRARFRIAGKLYEDTSMPGTMMRLASRPTTTEAVVSRIKHLASMDMNCRDDPQEGAITNHDGQTVLLLVTTVPTDAGEVIIVRSQEG